MAATPADLLREGLEALAVREPGWIEEDNYLRGTHPRPFAPPGVQSEYRALQDMAVAPWLKLVVRTPVQRLRIDGFRTGRDEEVDAATWAQVWQANNMDSRQRIVYTEAIAHGCGVMGVWPNKTNPASPIIRPESSRYVYLKPDPDDVFSSVWALKKLGTRTEYAGAGIKREIESAVLHTPSMFYRFEKVNGSGDWRLTLQGANPMGRIPFVEFAPEYDANGVKQSLIRPLFGMQRAIDTLRFDLLLAAQFAAYRQRIVTGWDPVQRDPVTGDPLWQVDDEGRPVVDHQGNRVPLLVSPGRPGVDRLMAFPGADTKVFDLNESNLDNYVKTIQQLVQHLAAISQVPPQYLLGDMANLSGEALDAAESTLTSMVTDLQTSFGESLEDVMRLANLARGDKAHDVASEAVWSQGKAQSFGQIVDGIQKLIASGFPRQAAFEMLPGATQTKVDRWMSMRDDELATQAGPLNDIAEKLGAS